jgi:hypothetical protein
MQAIQGIYDNGRVVLDAKAPVNKSRVIVVFTEDYQNTKMTAEEALKVLHKHAATIKGDFDIERERDEHLNEKLGPVN